MADTSSKMLPLGTTASYFNLIDTKTDKFVSLHNQKGKIATLIMFICNHCPFVIHVNKELVKLANDYTQRGIKFIAISSNDVNNYPQDRPELMKQVAEKFNYPFPYLYDKNQEVAKAYGATCTPDFFLFNSDLKLIYRGQLDASRPSNDIPVTGEDIRNALDTIIDGKEIDPNQIPSIGCSIKWK